MKRCISFGFALVLGLALVGCGDDTSTGGSGGTGANGGAGAAGGGGAGGNAAGMGGTGGTGGEGGNAAPPPPVLGTQIDRMGRPAISTALNHVFDPDQAAKDAAKDAWNADDETGEWIGNYSPEVAKNLAFFDGVDTMCGNQLLAHPPPPGPDTYQVLAGVLADDRLWLRTDADACNTYLAVEANAVGVVPNSDCGGRKLDYDPIDLSYSVLVAGSLSGVTDNVQADADTMGTTFPYLAAPH
ncbi:MAG: DUF4331 family protein [Polyangiaceae bacterium]|nr:DUF4331 family protein [Polyangiaceae bacterium]